MTSAALWGQIPLELRERAQWLLASPDAKGHLKVPTTIGPGGSLVSGSSTDRFTWLTFEEAYGNAVRYGLGIGFVLASDDPFVCIDLDVKGEHNEADPAKWTSASDKDRYWKIVQTFDSYTEVSQSGQGLHIWVYGEAAPGAKFGGVEVYSQERFIVCTGNVLVRKPMVERQTWINTLVAEIREKQGSTRKLTHLEELPPVDPDEVIYERARLANNHRKFEELWAGKWLELGYPSQSEADLALMSMFTFYSPSDEQCRRLFRGSALGQREKAQQDDRYIDLTLRLVRGRQAAEAKVEGNLRSNAEQMVKNMMAKASRLTPVEIHSYAASLGPEDYRPPVVPLSSDYRHQQPIAPAPSYIEPRTVATSDASLQYPPGRAGEIAKFIFATSPRPVREVAIVAALGLLAGICGKAWNIPGSGLNIYLILVARSAIGKEAMHSGIGLLIKAVGNGHPGFSQFVDFADFASGPALVKACSENQSFVNIAGEWGKKLKRLSDERGGDAAMQTLRTVMTNLYQKSGPASVVGGLSRAKSENSIASVSGVAFSMIGETTPGTLYDSLTDTMMEDGFLSRFTIVEYNGERPPLNQNQNQFLKPDLVQYLGDMAFQAQSINGNTGTKPIGVKFVDNETRAIANAFDKECDIEINKTVDEAWRQMWNRAHLKVLRIAALLAVVDNYEDPMIQPYHLAWAIDLIRRDIAVMARRVKSGDVGSGDGVRERKLVALIKEYFSTRPSMGYKVPDGMHEKGIVPRSYLQMRTARVSTFAGSRNGATKALDETIKSLCDSGYIMECDKKVLMDEFGTTGRAYRIVTLPDYEQHAKG